MALCHMVQGIMGWQQLGAWLCLILVTLPMTSCATARREELEAKDEMEEAKRSGCLSCGMPSNLASDAERQILNEVAKQQILSKLHLKERPNITHPMPRLAVANALRRLHPGRSRLDGLLGTPSTDDQGEGEDEQGYEIISFAETDITNASNAKLSFQFTRDHVQDIHILQARLWLYFKTQQNGTSNINARLYLTHPGETEHTLVSERQLDVAWEGWHTFPLTPAIQAFFAHNDKTLNLELKCEGGHGLMLNISDAHQPFLVAKAKVKEAEHHLAKRSLKCDKNSKLCCRKDYYVDFKDIGWQDWIIKPDGYHINYCMGLCPMHIAGAPGMAASFHTTVLNLIKANNINTATNSCCVPTKHRPLSLLYYDNNHNIVKMDIPNMIVDSCGCS